jgi:transcriptional regulator with XRE-family HTH domain
MTREPPDIEKIAIERIKQLRKAKGMTQEKLAARAELTTEAVTRVERGVRMPTLKTLGKIAHGLGVSPAALVDVGNALPEPVLSAPVARIVSRLEDQSEAVQVAAEDVVGALLRAVRDTHGKTTATPRRSVARSGSTR